MKKDTLHKKLQVQIKQEEEQLKQSISNISHDLRTPLTSIQGYLTLLQECENNQEQEQYLKIIKAKTDYLTELVQYFYDLSVLENEQSDDRYAGPHGRKPGKSRTGKPHKGLEADPDQPVP